MGKSFLTIIILFISILSFAQEINFEYGEISQEYLQMTEFPQDPEADAVVIFDRMDVKMQRDFTLSIKRHFRIKILTEAGKEEANREIFYDDDDDLYDIEAASYDVDGNVYELDSDDIVEEEIGSVRVEKFAIPNVQIGSIIEVEYSLISEYVTNLQPWTFSSNKFTILSEYSVQIRPGFAFDKLDLNFQNYDITATTNQVRDMDTGGREVLQKYIWTGMNLPPVKKEPYVENLDDEHAKLIFVFHSYKAPNGNTHSFSKSWKTISENIYPKYKYVLEDDSELPKELQHKLSEATNNLDSANVAYRFVCDEIVNDDYKSIYSDEYKLSEKIVEEKLASFNEKNLMLISFYKRMGLSADPVLISTRNNGRLIPSFKDPSQFNRLIVKLNIGRKEFYLHTGSKYLQFGDLPPKYSVSRGLQINSDNANIIEIKASKVSNKREIQTIAEILDDGSLKAKTIFEYKGYPAYYERIAMEDDDHNENVEERITDIFEAAKIDTFYYNDQGLENPLELIVEFTVSDMIDQSDEMIYLPAPMFSNETENLFTSEKRRFPISFNYDQYVSESCELILPKNMSVVELPKRASQKINNFSYRKTYSERNGKITIRRSTNLRTRKFGAHEYNDLKNFYDAMVSSDSELVVINKSKTAG